jgi:uncharacterized protein (TIGR03000 family)
MSRINRRASILALGATALVSLLPGPVMAAGGGPGGGAGHAVGGGPVHGGFPGGWHGGWHGAYPPGFRGYGYGWGYPGWYAAGFGLGVGLGYGAFYGYPYPAPYPVYVDAGSYGPPPYPPPNGGGPPPNGGAPPPPNGATNAPPAPGVQGPIHLTESDVLLSVRVPPEAAVWLNEQPTHQTGPRREFASSGLIPGRQYTFTVRARWTAPGGGIVDQERRISVQGGERRNVDFLSAENGPPLPPPDGR